MSERQPNDAEWEEATVTKVEGDGVKGWSIELDDGWSFFVPPRGVEPKVGDVARFYGRGIGCAVRGLELNGVVVFYETAEEYAARQKREQEERDTARLLTNPDYVWMDHAAIAPLTGCECGCQPVQDVEAERAKYEEMAGALIAA